MNVYQLRDPNDFVIKYVGITKHSIEYRLMMHIKDTKGRLRRNEYLSGKDKWILNLLSDGQKPIPEYVLADVGEKAAMNLEKHLINIIKREAEGGTLKNVQGGGTYDSCKATPWNKGIKDCYSDSFIHAMTLNQPYRKNIYRFSRDGSFIDSWNSVRSMCESLHFDRRTVQRCLNKRPNYMSHKGFMFSYSLNDIPVYVNQSALLTCSLSPHAKKIKVVKDEKTIEFGSIKDAANSLHIGQTLISRALKKQMVINGFKFIYINGK